MWRWRTASTSVLPTNAFASSVSPPVLESYLPSTPFEKRKTFLCSICMSICWRWRHGKWIIGLMGNVGERGIEKDREKAAWEKKKTAITGLFFSAPHHHHSSFHHPPLNHLCCWKDLPWPPIFTLSAQLPPSVFLSCAHESSDSLSSIFIQRLPCSLCHPQHGVNTPISPESR